MARETSRTNDEAKRPETDRNQKPVQSVVLRRKKQDRRVRIESDPSLTKELILRLVDLIKQV